MYMYVVYPMLAIASFYLVLFEFKIHCLNSRVQVSILYTQIIKENKAATYTMNSNRLLQIFVLLLMKVVLDLLFSV